MSDYKITIEGILETEEIHFMGFFRYIKFEDIQKYTLEDSKKITDLLSNNITIKGYRMNIIKGISDDFKSFFSIYGIDVELSEGANYILNGKNGVWGIIPAHPSMLKVILCGSYEYLAEAWQKTMHFIQKNKLAIDHYSNPLLVYKSESDNPKKLLTEIYVPLILTIDTNLDYIKL